MHPLNVDARPGKKKGALASWPGVSRPTTQLASVQSCKAERGIPGVDGRDKPGHDAGCETVAAPSLRGAQRRNNPVAAASGFIFSRVRHP